MTQDSLFEASVYVRRAYDQLVLAVHHEPSDELESLKWQTLQTWLSLQEARLSTAALESTLPLDQAFGSPGDDLPF